MMLEQFHFLQPLWLLALLPLVLIYLLVIQSSSDSTAWDKIIDANLLPWLLQGENRNAGKLAKFLLATGWIISVVALADPVWEKIPRPVFQTNTARILVLDLSNSMLIDDLKPSRLSRARFKIEDILSREEEGQTGLVLFAGDAFTASPLTRDTETIRSYLKILTPQLMPAQGSRVDLGLIKAHELFKQAGVNNGQILLIADGVGNPSEAIEAANDLRNDGHSVSVLGVGTEAGGELKFRNNQSVSIKLESDILLDIANNGGGNYHLITTNNVDLQNVLTSNTGDQTVNDNDLQQQLKNEEWKSSGSFLVLLLLPLAALAFRRGWLFNLFFAFVLVGLIVQPQTVWAFSSEKQWQNLWLTLSQNKEQRADSALHQQQYEKASQLSNDPIRRGSAEYKQGKYSQAVESFKQAKGADARYNEANTLAKLKKYKEAIAAYDEALKLEANMKDALENKKAVEEFLKKHQEQSKDPENQSDSEKQKGQQNSEGQQNKDNKKNQQGGQQSDKNQGQKNQNEEQQQNDSQEGKQSEQQQSSKKDQEKGQKNQFSDANKALESNEKDEETRQQAKNDLKNESEKVLADKDQTEQQQNKASEDVKKDETNNKETISQDNGGTKEELEELTKEEKMAAEQWLRRIPDDPGGLLRRKFRSQYKQRQRDSNNSEQPW